jgi:hypothetical protein
VAGRQVAGWGMKGEGEKQVRLVVCCLDLWDLVGSCWDFGMGEAIGGFCVEQ